MKYKRVRLKSCFNLKFIIKGLIFDIIIFISPGIPLDPSNCLLYENSFVKHPYFKAKTFIETKVTAMKLQGFPSRAACYLTAPSQTRTSRFPAYGSSQIGFAF